MTTTPPEAPQQGHVPPPGPHGPAGDDGGPRVSWDDVRDLGRIHRVTYDRRIAGVAGGIARHLDIDPVIVRVGFVVLTLFGGVGALLYLALWLLLPEDGADLGRVALDRRSRTVALVLVGVLAVVLFLSRWGWWGAGFPWVVLAVAGLVVLLVTQRPSRRRREQAAQTQANQTQAAQTQAAQSVPPSTPAPSSAASSAGPAAESTTGIPTGTAVTPPTSPPDYGVGYVEPPRPANPRRRGPILFWAVLGLAAVALGILWVADLAGADIAPSAYPATVMGICGLGLLLGAFFGRAGGLILVGLLAWPVTAAFTVADRLDFGRSVERPTSAASVRSDYQMDNGELVVDLSRVRDIRALDGRTIHVEGNVGHLDLRVPPNVNVVAHLDIDGPGGISAFGQDVGGLGHVLDTRYQAGPKRPTITLDAQLDVGGIDLHTQEASR